MRRILIGGTLAAILVILLALWPGRPPATPEPETVVSTARHARSYQPGSRTRVPLRPRAPSPTPVEAAPPTPDAPVPAPAASEPIQAPPADGPVDRREHPTGDVAALQKAIRSRMDEVRDEVDACLQQWFDVDPDLSGEVTLRFGVDAGGLDEVWIEDHEGIPAGPLSCFGDAVASADWTGVTDDPLEVSFGFEVDPDEAPR